MGWFANLLFNQKEFELKHESYKIISARQRKAFECELRGCDFIMPMFASIEETEKYKCPKCFNNKKHL